MSYVQAMKAQALTLLATWVVADTSHAVAGRIRQQDLPARILEDLVNRAHHFLPGPHGQMAVQVSLLHGKPSLGYAFVTVVLSCPCMALEHNHISLTTSACQRLNDCATARAGQETSSNLRLTRIV